MTPGNSKLDYETNNDRSDEMNKVLTSRLCVVSIAFLSADAEKGLKVTFAVNFYI
jgi:hypothetical protein